MISINGRVFSVNNVTIVNGRVISGGGTWHRSNFAISQFPRHNGNKVSVFDIPSK